MCEHHCILDFHSFHPTLYVLFLITFTKPLPERTCLSWKLKRGSKGKDIGHWVNGIEEVKNKETTILDGVGEKKNR